MIIWVDLGVFFCMSIVIVIMLVEFQEVQVWFVFVVQIVFIFVIVVNLLEGMFWGEVVFNVVIVYYISQNGILLMFFIQVCLYNEGICNWYMFFGFFVEYFLVIIVIMQKVGFYLVVVFFKYQNEIVECGGQLSL